MGFYAAHIIIVAQHRIIPGGSNERQMFYYYDLKNDEINLQID